MTEESDDREILQAYENDLREKFKQEVADAKWRPIDTAPHDGTVIWLGCRSTSSLGYWNLAEQCFKAADFTVDNLDQLPYTPTHWQPYCVPDPPIC